MKRLFLFLTFLTLFFLKVFTFSSLLTAEDKFYSQYAKDYENFQQKKYLHSPVKEKNCSACHISIKEKKKFPAQGSQLCFTCHKDLAKKIKEEAITSKVHSLLKDGECSICHEVHSANNLYLLNDTGKDCATCHEPKDYKKAHFGILLKKGTCNSCHQAHYSTKGKLLIETGHPMFLEGGCDACHLPSTPEGKSQLSARDEKLCYSCHADIQELEKKKVVHLVLKDCTFCHSAHVAKEKKLLLKKMNTLCYDCHLLDVFREHPLPKHPVERKNFNCLSCHNAHASDNKKMLNDTGKDCTNCHNPKEKKILQAHSEIIVGKNSCPKCHTKVQVASMHPDFAKNNCLACHSKNPKEGKVELIKPGKELCYLCHSGIKSDLEKKYPHGIVKDGECSVCHEVHSSLERSLLNATGNDCTTCHDPENITKAHFGIIAKKESCTKCHQAHGSEKEKLLFPKGHPFIYDKSCDPCHQANPPAGKVLLAAEGEKLCFMCHADIEDLLKKKIVHQVAKDCTLCHLAHVSNLAKLLPKSSEQLCSDCHPNIGLHPVGRHPISGVTDPRFSKERKSLTCLSCHNPHGAEYEGLLFADKTTGELCLSCHKK